MLQINHSLLLFPQRLRFYILSSKFSLFFLEVSVLGSVSSIIFYFLLKCSDFGSKLFKCCFVHQNLGWATSIGNLSFYHSLALLTVILKLRLMMRRNDICKSLLLRWEFLGTLRNQCTVLMRLDGAPAVTSVLCFEPCCPARALSIYNRRHVTLVEKHYFSCWVVDVCHCIMLLLHTTNSAILSCLISTFGVVLPHCHVLERDPIVFSFQRFNILVHLIDAMAIAVRDLG